MGVLRKIEQLFRGAGFEKLPLVGVEFARLVKLPPFGKGKHPVTVVVLQPVRIETLIISDVFPLSLAEGSYQVVLLVEAVCVTERLVPGGKLLAVVPLPKKAEPSISSGTDNPARFKTVGPKSIKLTKPSVRVPRS